APKYFNISIATSNKWQDACDVSPAKAVKALAGTTTTKSATSFSNYGHYAKLATLGQEITSTWIGGTSSSKKILISTYLKICYDLISQDRSCILAKGVEISKACHSQLIAITTG
ncbi:hypothetical protein K7432_015884, partial [Basidiobolus ranarum]